MRSKGVLRHWSAEGILPSALLEHSLVKGSVFTLPNEPRRCEDRVEGEVGCNKVTFSITAYYGKMDSDLTH